MAFSQTGNNSYQKQLKENIIQTISGTHDLDLPDWGPYTRKYAGISHICDKENGFRFDLSVFPGYFRRKINIPSVRYESEFHPWESSSDFSYFSYRHEVEWKDQVYCDVSFSKTDDNSRLIRAELVNNTDISQNLVLHYMANIDFPPENRTYLNVLFKPAVISIPMGAVWVDAVDYKSLYFAEPSPTNNLMPDGFLRGEIRANGYVNGSALARNFGKAAGDSVTYEFTLNMDIREPVILFRYNLPKEQKTTFILGGIASSEIEFTGNGEISTKLVPLKQEKLPKGRYTLTLTSKGGDPIAIDGFVVTENKSVNSVSVKDAEWNNKPLITEGPVKNSVILKYENISNYYGISWSYDSYETRELYCNELEGFFNKQTTTYNTPVLKNINSINKEQYTNVYFRPVIVKPKSSRVIYGFVCSGNKEEVAKQIETFNKSQNYEPTYLSAKKQMVQFNSIPAGKQYLFSQQLMAATVLTDIIYPIYTKRQYIKAFVPGKAWDCLYTWDAGFTNMALIESDINVAIQNLNAYLTEPGDINNAFILHGTPVPTQIYSFLEIWNKTQSKELLQYFYPRLKQYYMFLAGDYGSSTTRMKKSNLISTWDYFYNSGGWDDYPPQVFVHKNNIEKNIAPVSNTVHCIRTAKILKMAALELGLNNDIQIYDNDIRDFSEALQKYSWDSISGYFSYVVHDDNGIPDGILKYENKVNFNMGLDGTYPIVGGICTKEQQSKILSNLKSENNLWTPIGISTVDQSAPYFRKDGYWNGSVWFAHQWFLWKTMLDIGEDDFAYKIVRTALDTWKKEVETTYNCPEHFEIESGRGAGWQEASGIVCPIIPWFASYYIPGNITCGFDTWINNKTFSDDNTSLSAGLKFYGDNSTKRIIIACMNPDYEYKIMFNGKEIENKKLAEGLFYIYFSGNIADGKLIIEKL